MDSPGSMDSRFGQQGRSGLLKGPNTLEGCSLRTSWCATKQENRDQGDALREQLKEMDEHNGRLQNMLRTERAKSSCLQLQCLQQEAELRRQELHCNKLKEKLSQLTDGQKAIEVLNVPPGSRGKREHLSKPFRPNARQEEATLHLMLERREAELREAMKLRHSLTTLLHALRLDMERSVTELMDVEQEGEGSLVETETSLGEDVTGGVIQSWRKVLKKLRDILSEGRTAASTDHDKLMAQLETELKESQQLVRLQQQLLQDSLVSPLPLELSDSYYLEEWERLQMSLAELNRQRRTFERERQAFTDAAIRLSRERHDLEQQRACYVKQQYLCASSPFGQGAQTSNGGESSAFGFSSGRPTDVSGCHPITPSSTESGNEGGARVQTPDTPELYAALNLSYNHRSRHAEHQSEMWDGVADKRLHTPWPSYLDWSF
ncbi:afadin- and alpha-actinin-binding protein isoform X2 [Nematolebias whitei]|uniref:afadin- and alpha-actinin-binding protein isoform X2 n=1 Tax=Nematolebias whitei TaxID=451745 RepID=UPI0018997106|nr:afadin- and alpha-actinin-binding protein isoform X2 [Nematolebias whitei]